MHNPLRRPLGLVLVAVDLSPATNMVLDRVARLPVTPGSPIVLLHVVPLDLPVEERDLAVEQARRDLATCASRPSLVRVGRAINVTRPT